MFVVELVSRFFGVRLTRADNKVLATHCYWPSETILQLKCVLLSLGKKNQWQENSGETNIAPVACALYCRCSCCCSLLHCIVQTRLRPVRPLESTSRQVQGFIVVSLEVGYCKYDFDRPITMGDRRERALRVILWTVLELRASSRFSSLKLNSTRTHR